jgi:MinD superfamily P-loop ATPase
VSTGVTKEQLIYLADKSFTADDTCNGCAICSRVCPVGNIRMVDNKPKWLNHCENCLACYNWCPQKAIKNGLMQKDFYYLNPQITLAEFKGRKVKN